MMWVDSIEQALKTLGVESGIEHRSRQVIVEFYFSPRTGPNVG